MFQNYEIKKIKQEEVLILYFDLNTEFAKLESNKKTTIQKEITNYIKKENIPFKGKKVILMVGSIIIGSILYAAPLLKENIPTNSYNYTANILSLKEKTIDQEQIITEKTKENISQEEIKKQNTNSNTNITKSSEYNKNLENNLSKTSTNNSQNKTEKEQQIENKQMISIKRSNGTIIYMELEEYLIGVVAGEMPASFEIEALKAQAIAARTYALKSLENNTILTDTTSSQVYKDQTELKNLWGSNYNKYYNKVKNAVLATKGIAMYYNNTLINAYYHSTSNGKTEDSSAVFGSYPYLKSVDSMVDKNVTSYIRTNSYTYESISNILGIPVTSLSTITINRNNSDRITKIIIDGNIYGGIEFRSKLKLRSTDFDIVLNENNLTITTRGYGHGVGMSQYGANEYAKLGWNYQKILTHYYTGITLQKD